MMFDDVQFGNKDINSNQKVSADHPLPAAASVIMTTHSPTTSRDSKFENNLALTNAVQRTDAVNTEGHSATLQPSIGFEDDFNINMNAEAPPVPPKIPLKRGHTIDTSTVSSSSTGIYAPISLTSVPESGRPEARPRTSIARQPAFYKQQRPASFRKSSATSQQAMDAQTIKDARTAFMKSDTTKSVMQRRDELDQFDPLVTGQLAVDTPCKNPESQTDDEENLLKEWNLDFESRLKSSYQPPPPPLPPKPVTLQSLRPYSSSPGLNTIGGYWSGVGSPYQTAVCTQRASPLPRPRHHQSVQQLIRHFSPCGSGQSPGLVMGRPVSQVMMRNKTNVSLNLDRPASMYVESQQDPFSDLVTISTVPSCLNQTMMKSTLPPNIYTNGGTTMSSAAVSVSGIGQSVALNTTIQPGPIIENPHSPLSLNTPNKGPQMWETFD